MVETIDTQDMLSGAVERMLAINPSAAPRCEGKPKVDLWTAAIEIGLTAAEFRPECGGLGLTFADIAPAFREIGRALASTYLTEFAVMGGWLIDSCNAVNVESMVLQAAAGEVRVALAIAEYGDGGDIGFTKTKAVLTQDSWTLDGFKTLMVGGDRATHLVVSAVIGSSSANPIDLALFVVPRDAVGLNANVFELYDGSYSADFRLDGVKVPIGSLIARGAEAVDLIELALDRGRAATCHEAVGLIEKVHEITLDYVKTRRQFGQPIGVFQTMQHRMADMHMEIEIAHSCAQLATDAIVSRGDKKKRMQAISAAMVGICGCARRVGQSAVQAHGGIALTREYVVGHYFKRLTMIERYLGNAEYHLERYIEQSPAQSSGQL